MGIQLQKQKDNSMEEKSEALTVQDYTALGLVALMVGLILGYFYHVVMVAG